MKKTKRVAALLLAATMAFGLAACGKGGNAGGSGDGGAGTPAGKDTATKSGDIVKLVVWGNGSADTED